MKLPLSAVLLLLFTASLTAQRVSTGPMLGANNLREVTVWIQTDQACEAYLRFWPQGTKQPAKESNRVQTLSTEAFTAHLTCPMLEPGTTYDYEVVLNGKAQSLDVPTEFTTQSLWQWRQDPPEWTLAIGSCAYINEAAYDRPGTPYGKSTHIFSSIAETNPEVMLWMGDNVYFREVDWGSWSGMLHRYTHMRQVPEMQPLLATVHNYAIWDDHDYGPNDSNSSWIHKDRAKQAFELFWANDNYGTSDLPGITSQFHFNDVEFFLLDDRWHRTHPDLEGQPLEALGKAQVDWLIHALATSNAPFKLVVVGNQFLSDFDSYENLSRYAQERQDILDRIEANNIEGVVFLTGDRHSTELSKLELSNGKVVYDLTCSPLTSTSYDHSQEPNTLRVPGTHVGTQNFGLLTFSGSWKERVMHISIRNADGKEMWNCAIHRNGNLQEAVQRPSVTAPQEKRPEKLQKPKK